MRVTLGIAKAAAGVVGITSALCLLLWCTR
jgi:hypothetical protein